MEPGQLTLQRRRKQIPLSLVTEMTTAWVPDKKSLSWPMVVKSSNFIMAFIPHH